MKDGLIVSKICILKTRHSFNQKKTQFCFEALKIKFEDRTVNHAAREMLGKDVFKMM